MKTDTTALRRRAEEFLDRNPDAANKVPAGDLHKLIEDLQMVKKDGRQFYARLESGAIQEKAGNNRQIRMAVTDVSDHVQARGALRQSEEKYRLLFNEMISGYALHEIIFDSKGKPADSLILEVNKTIEWHTGFKKEQLIGKTVREILPDTEPDWFEKFAEVVITGNPIQFENYHQQLDKHFMVSAFRLQGSQVAATFTDITERRRFQKELQKAHDDLENRVEERTAELSITNEQLELEIEDRKQAEKALIESESRYRTLFDISTGAIFLETLEGRILHCNTSACEMFGYTKEELIGLTVADTSAPGRCENFTRYYKKTNINRCYFYGDHQQKERWTRLPGRGQYAAHYAGRRATDFCPRP